MAATSWQHRGHLRDPDTGQAHAWPAVGRPLLRSRLHGPDLAGLERLRGPQKWFFGKGPRPQFDRWTYWEKFDYFAVFWGVFAIGLSGLIMWFPEFFSRFMPGWMINVALIVHSDEALLAAGFIFTVHFFNTHFRLEKFPMDTVIFSGPHLQVRDAPRAQALVRPPGRQRAGSTTSGSGTNGSAGRASPAPSATSSSALGVVLLVLIVYAMVSRLTH